MAAGTKEDPWVDLGAADEKKDVTLGTVEA